MNSLIFIFYFFFFFSGLILIFIYTPDDDDDDDDHILFIFFSFGSGYMRSRLSKSIVCVYVCLGQCLMLSLFFMLNLHHHHHHHHKSNRIEWMNELRINKQTDWNGIYFFSYSRRYSYSESYEYDKKFSMMMMIRISEKKNAASSIKTKIYNCTKKNILRSRKEKLFFEWTNRKKNKLFFKKNRKKLN